MSVDKKYGVGCPLRHIASFSDIPMKNIFVHSREKVFFFGATKKNLFRLISGISIKFTEILLLGSEKGHWNAIEHKFDSQKELKIAKSKEIREGAGS